MTKNLSMLLYGNVNLHIQLIITYTKSEIATKTRRHQE